MLITSDFLKRYDVCTSGLVKFNRVFPDYLNSRSVGEVRFAINNGLDVRWGMRKFPEIFDSEEVICELLAFDGRLLRYIKVSITQKMVNIAMISSIYAFPYVPECSQTEEMVHKALTYDGKYLKYVRIPITRRMVDIAMNNTVYALPYVPLEFRTEEMRKKYEALLIGDRYY